MDQSTAAAIDRSISIFTSSLLEIDLLTANMSAAGTRSQILHHICKKVRFRYRITAFVEEKSRNIKSETITEDYSTFHRV
jgi:hypothetical protein